MRGQFKRVRRRELDLEKSKKMTAVLLTKGFLSLLAGAATFAVLRRFWRKKAPAICTNTNMLDGRTVIVTGANTGIGKEIAMELARRNARVIMGCRNVVKGQKAAEDIKNQIGSCELVVKELDLASFRSVREFSKDVIKCEKAVNILINNAGVFGPPFALTEDGHETTFAVNHLGHFLLTNLLLEKLEDCAPARIIIVASKLYEKAKVDFENLNGELNYKGFTAYAHSKLANMLFSFELSKRLPKG